MQSISQIRLRAGSIEVLAAHRAPYEIQCLEGSVWVTCERCRCDHVLRPGQSLTIAPNQIIIAESLVPNAMVGLNPLPVEFTPLSTRLRRGIARLAARLSRLSPVR